MTVDMMKYNVQTNKSFVQDIHKELVHKGKTTVRCIGEIKIANNKFVCNGKSYSHLEQIFI